MLMSHLYETTATKAFHKQDIRTVGKIISTFAGNCSQSCERLEAKVRTFTALPLALNAFDVLSTWFDGPLLVPDTLTRSESLAIGVLCNSLGTHSVLANLRHSSSVSRHQPPDVVSSLESIW